MGFDKIMFENPRIFLNKGRFLFCFGAVTVKSVMNFFAKLLKSLLDFTPWLLVHILLCCAAGGYIAYDLYGEEGAVTYYKPLIIGLAAAFVLSLTSYLLFGRQDYRYTAAELGDFDKVLIYCRFGGLHTKKLREAVIDMHLFGYNTALEKFKELEETELSDEQRAVLSFYMGRCYQLMGYPSNGIKYYRAAIELGLDLNDTYLLAARCLSQNGCFDEAIEYYKVLLERDACFDFIYTDIGIAYLKKGDSGRALESFEKSISEGKNYAFALGGCSLAYLQMKNLEKSGEYYKKALTCNMDDVNGFKVFYCNIAEAEGLLDEIDPNMKLRSEDGGEIIR